MCTAYKIGRGAIAQLTSPALAAPAADLPSAAEVLMRPTHRTQVLLPTGEWAEMRWGFSRPWSKAIVNSRDDKLDGPVWREAWQNRRCLLPMTSYYEWSGPTGNKTTHHFFPTTGDLFWAAGIWEDTSEHGPCYSLITCRPNALVERVHDRMPALLLPDQHQAFLRHELHTFHPPPELLRLESPAINPLRPTAPIQGELF
jgi:putative SOS response-associated peptidase YedK